LEDERRHGKCDFESGSGGVGAINAAVQKALTEMNIRPGKMLSDLSGVNGMVILKAILDGQRDPTSIGQVGRPPGESL
jgi:hypothetical protein